MWENPADTTALQIIKCIKKKNYFIFTKFQSAHDILTKMYTGYTRFVRICIDNTSVCKSHEKKKEKG